MDINMNNTVRRVITVVLTMLMILGIAMFSYACYAVEECEQIEDYYGTPHAQQTFLVDYLK